MMLADRPSTSLETLTGVGPGTYNPCLPSSSAVCTAQFRSKTVRGEPFAWRLPGPGAYDVPSGRGIRGGLSPFRGGARTLDMTAPGQAATPGSGSYEVASSLAIAPVQGPVKAAADHFEWRRRPTAPAIPAYRDKTGHVGPWSYSPQYSKASRERCVPAASCCEQKWAVAKTKILAAGQANANILDVGSSCQRMHAARAAQRKTLGQPAAS
jgi:hypothetical protein